MELNTHTLYHEIKNETSSSNDNYNKITSLLTKIFNLDQVTFPEINIKKMCYFDDNIFDKCEKAVFHGIYISINNGEILLKIVKQDDNDCNWIACKIPNGKLFQVNLFSVKNDIIVVETENINKFIENVRTVLKEYFYINDYDEKNKIELINQLYNVSDNL